MSSNPIPDGTTRCIARAGSRWSRCPCPEHKAQLARIQKQSRTYGPVPRIPWQQGWARFCQLLDDGWSPSAIADAAGLHPRSTLNAAETRAAGKVRRFGHHTCERLLGDLQRPMRGTLPATPSRRRLRALARLGWRLTDLNAATGIAMSTLSVIQRGATTAILARQAAAITDAYQRLQHQDGPSRVTADSAYRKGWAAPAAWDNPDDLTERPKGLGAAPTAKTATERPYRPPLRPECGTKPGYDRHKRNKETRCTPCLDWASRYGNTA